NDSALFTKTLNLRPAGLTLNLQFDVIVIDLFELKTATRLTVTFTIWREATQQAKHLRRDDILLL
ncbi:hypothetical protein, partial [Pseudomonas aeruginosa]|uniref:hypothetical protein n=1 Tax=Pseudomonas aeruginosa TaxID=287 RepID=UPI0031FD2B07